jgi:hypothetical protein
MWFPIGVCVFAVGCLILLRIFLSFDATGSGNSDHLLSGNYCHFGAVISGSVASQRPGAMGLLAARDKEDDRNAGPCTDSDPA